MKFIASLLVVVALVAIAAAAPAPVADRNAETLQYDVNVEPENYNFSFQTSDGKSFQESGVVEDLGTTDEAIAVRGSYSYIGDDGQTYQVNYVADRFGFRPEGSHIPVA